MTSGWATVAEEIRRLAAELPLPLVASLADALREVPSPQSKKVELAVQDAIPQPHYRALALELLDAWRVECPTLSAEALAFALVTAARSAEFVRKDQGLELVWTGPDVGPVPPRQTEQVLLQLISSAKSTLTVVSFVAYKVPTVSTALAEAARRGVVVRFVLESAEASEGKVAFDAIKAFGADVADRSSVYVWPLDKRPKDSSGHHGLLHAKCAIADGARLLVSSANLTGHALSLNMDLGILVRGGAVARQGPRVLRSAGGNAGLGVGDGLNARPRSARAARWRPGRGRDRRRRGPSATRPAAGPFAPAGKRNRLAGS